MRPDRRAAAFKAASRDGSCVRDSLPNRHHIYCDVFVYNNNNFKKNTDRKNMRYVYHSHTE